MRPPGRTGSGGRHRLFRSTQLDSIGYANVTEERDAEPNPIVDRSYIAIVRCSLTDDNPNCPGWRQTHPTKPKHRTAAPACRRRRDDRAGPPMLRAQSTGQSTQHPSAHPRPNSRPGRMPKAKPVRQLTDTETGPTVRQAAARTPLIDPQSPARGQRRGRYHLETKPNHTSRYSRIKRLWATHECQRTGLSLQRLPPSPVRPDGSAL
jgi:hypothetical protein